MEEWEMESKEGEGRKKLQKTRGSRGDWRGEVVVRKEEMLGKGGRAME